MILFLYGPDTFRSRGQMKKMIDKFKSDRDPQGYNVSRMDAEKEIPGKILEQILATPFLAEKRLVVVENLLISKHKDLRADLLKRIEEKNLPESNIILFWEGSDKFKTKDSKLFFERLSKEKYAQHFDTLKGVKLSAWVAREIKDRGGNISNHATSYLVQNVGSDMWHLNSLLDQLIAFKGEKEIQIKDISIFLDEKVDDNIFNLVDAIVGGNAKNVFAMIREQYKQGKDPQYVFAMILRQFRILIELRDLFEREDNIASNVLASRTGLHPFVVKKSLPFVRRYSLDKLSRIYNDLLDFDIKTKTGTGDPVTLLDVFVGRVCVS